MEINKRLDNLREINLPRSIRYLLLFVLLNVPQVEAKSLFNNIFKSGENSDSVKTEAVLNERIKELENEEMNATAFGGVLFQGGQALEAGNERKNEEFESGQFKIQNPKFKIQEANNDTTEISMTTIEEQLRVFDQDFLSAFEASSDKLKSLEKAVKKGYLLQDVLTKYWQYTKPNKKINFKDELDFLIIQRYYNTSTDNASYRMVKDLKLTVPRLKSLYPQASNMLKNTFGHPANHKPKTAEEIEKQLPNQLPERWSPWQVFQVGSFGCIGDDLPVDQDELETVKRILGEEEFKREVVIEIKNEKIKQLKNERIENEKIKVGVIISGEGKVEVEIMEELMNEKIKELNDKDPKSKIQDPNEETRVINPNSSEWSMEGTKELSINNYQLSVKELEEKIQKYVETLIKNEGISRVISSEVEKSNKEGDLSATVEMTNDKEVEMKSENERMNERTKITKKRMNEGMRVVNPNTSEWFMERIKKLKNESKSKVQVIDEKIDKDYLKNNFDQELQNCGIFLKRKEFQRMVLEVVSSKTLADALKVADKYEIDQPRKLENAIFKIYTSYRPEATFGEEPDLSLLFSSMLNARKEIFKLVPNQYGLKSRITELKQAKSKEEVEIVVDKILARNPNLNRKTILTACLSYELAHSLWYTLNFNGEKAKNPFLKHEELANDIAIGKREEMEQVINELENQRMNK